MEEDLRKRVEAARSGRDARAWFALVEALKTAAGSTVLELLGSNDPPLRRAAVAAAAGRLHEEALLTALKAVVHDKDPSVRRALAEAIEGAPIGSLSQVLETLLHDDDDSVRSAAARSAKRHLSAESALLLRVDESQESNWSVRRAAAQSLEGHGRDASLLPLLSAIAHDSVRAVATAAAATLETLIASRGEPTAKVELALLEAAQAKLISFGPASRHKALLAWIETRLSHDVDVKKLKEFGADLTAEVEQGKLPHAHGAARVVDELERVLTGDGVRGAVLLGEPGSGKTAIVHELTHRLSARGWRVVRFSPVELLAGTRYLGEWQTKLNDLMRAVKAPRKVLLYCPNLQELSDAGRTSVSDINMATALAPRIEAGEIAIVGESTPESFRAGLGAIPSLRRLFHAVEIKEATPEETRSILEELRRESRLPVPPAVLDRLIELADSYLPQISLPGRAAGLLRRVIETQPDERTEPLTTRDVLKTLSGSTGVPVDLLDDTVPLDLAAVRAFFEARVMGQGEAIDAVTDLVALVKAGLTDPGKPFGVLFFVGPTGVGKTELARALAEFLFGDVKRMVRFDMSEFATYDAYERLIGRGERPGLLTAAVRERPFSVLLFDEIEKAHANVFDLCLQLFDAGRLTDSFGRTADFRRTIVVLTSNVGSRVQDEAPLGFAGERRGTPTQDTILRELSRFFRPEFLNRLDRVVIFRPLPVEIAERIARREVAKVIERSGITRRALAVDVDPGAIALLLRDGYSPAFGARPLKRTVERLVLLPAARAIAAGGVVAGSVLRLVARGDKVEVEVVPPHDSLEAVPGKEELALDERAALLSTRVGALRPRAAPLSTRKAELLALSGQKGFWNDHAAARRSLDEVHRLEGVISALEHLERRVLAETERAEKRRGLPPKDLIRTRERIDALEAETARVEFLLGCRDARDLGDCFVQLALVKSSGAPLEAVEKLASMYLGLARRRGLEVEVVGDRKGGDPAEDSILLSVSGAGAFATLAGEAGLHHVSFGRPEGKEDREAVRVEVLSAPGFEAPEFAKDELKIEARPLKGVKGRLLEKPNLEVTVLHLPSLISARAWTAGSREQAVAKLKGMLRARVDAKLPESTTGAGAPVVRRYTLGPSPLVRDPRSGRSTGRLDRVLEGDLDAFLTLPAREAEAEAR